MLAGNSLDDVVVEQEWGVLCLLHVELEEGLWAERRVRGDGNVLGLAELDESFLGEVRVVLNLQSGGEDAGVAEEIQD